MKLIVTFMDELEEASLRRSNTSLKNILNVLDWTNLSNGDKVRLRKVIVDEINEMRRDLLIYFKNTTNGD